MSWLPAILTPGRFIADEPLKLTPPIFLAVARVVAVPAFPVMLPVIVPVTSKAPLTFAAVLISNKELLDIR